MFTGQRPTPLSSKEASTTTGEPWSEPSSPSSQSWNEKSTPELVNLLKNAHASLREKDKDLVLAAELGHYLLEKNIALKSQYDDLIRQQDQHSVCSIVDNDDQDSDHSLVLLSQHQTHQRILTDLQDQNIELQMLLNDAQQRSDELQTTRNKKARDLEYSIRLLKDHLELASRRIEEMEREQRYGNAQHRQQYQHNQHHDLHIEKQQQHNAILDELRNKINQLEYENNQLVHTRQSVQCRLERALIDMDTLQTQYQRDEWTRERYAQLENAYQQQSCQIAQLNHSLEEHRQVLSNLIDHDNYDYQHSDSSVDGIVAEINDHGLGNGHNNNLMAELEKVWNRDQFGKTDPDYGTAIETSCQQHHQQQQYQHDNDDDDDGYSSLISEGIKQHQQNMFDSANYINNASNPDSPQPVLDHVPSSKYTDISDSQAYDHVIDDIGYNRNDDDDDDLFGPKNTIDAMTSYDLYPNLAVAAQQPKEQSPATLGMVHKAQRWCRFAIVLTVAVLINAFEGPDALLEEMY